MRVGAFDAGFRFGYGFLGGGKPPLSGSHEIQGSSLHLGLALCKLDEWLGRMMREHRPDAVAFAIPFIGSKITPVQLRPLMAFAGKIEEVAFELEIPCYELDEPAARRHLLVNVPRGTDAIKKAIVAEWRHRGVPCCDDHAGDALCVANHALELLRPKSAHETTPLFQGDRS